MEESQKRAVTILSEFLKTSPTCAVLGLTCIVALFIDIESRRSELVIQQLGAWAAHYGAPVVGGSGRQIGFDSGFLAWEQLIRQPAPNAGIHQSLIDAVQTGSLKLVTVVFFALYYWSFMEVCRQRLDWFNRLAYLLVLGVLFVFLLAAHRTSGNFQFVRYEGWGSLFSSFWLYFVAWCGVVVITVSWDCCEKAANGNRCPQSPQLTQKTARASPSL